MKSNFHILFNFNINPYALGEEKWVKAFKNMNPTLSVVNWFPLGTLMNNLVSSGLYICVSEIVW